MVFESLQHERQEELKDLFCSTFTSSEGTHEGELIGALASRLASKIDDADIICFGALDNQALIGALFFTRLWFQDDALVYLLSPVAVSTTHQGTGIGKALIRFALNSIHAKGAVIAITYGDPAFYGKVGFEPLSESVLMAPMTLSLPNGWLGQSLTGEPIEARQDQPSCVEAFRDNAYW
jgi:putative acetyltransferase